VAKSIIIIGAGLGGLAAGIYGQMNGFDTHIYEMHSRAGGQCASWKRSGYTFDACIHHLMGCSPKLKINQIWSEIGAMPTDMVYTKECVSVASPDGKMLIDYYDPKVLEEHLLSLSPQDKDVIHEYIEGIRRFSASDVMGELLLDGVPGMLRNIPVLFQSRKWFTASMNAFAKRFSDPFLQRAFPLLVYSLPDSPSVMHIMRHASGCQGDIAWPVGGCSPFIDGIVKRYKELGGKIDFNSTAEKILVSDGTAAGIRLKDGTEHYADYIISDADGRKTLMDMLEGRFMDDRLRGFCAEPDDETNWAVHVFLGVNRDLSAEPSSLIQLLEQPVTIAGHELNSLEMQIYGYDKSMAPEGKGVIKVELISSYSYWKKLSKPDYEAEKEKVARQVLEILEMHFPGITNQVEVMDIPTLLTWERFMGGTHGFCNMPKKAFSVSDMFFGNKITVPGLDRFYFAGVWATSAGATFINALSGKKAVQQICRKEKIKFHVL
jgi:phytoene dehydrogenase-like protein